MGTVSGSAQFPSMWNTQSSIPIYRGLLMQSFPQPKVSQEVLALYTGSSLDQDPVTSLGYCQYIEVHMFILFCVYLSEMGFLISKESSAPSSSTPVYFMSKNYILRSCKYLQKWQNLTKNNLKLQGALWGMFQLDKIIH